MATKELVLSRERIQSRVIELGQLITADYRGKNLVMIGVLNGAFIFLADLVRAVTTAHE
ncbi:Hypoxanthine-guanine phosphoribosyltransferase, partial [hydrothermal vent metagenome]